MNRISVDTCHVLLVDDSSTDLELFTRMVTRSGLPIRITRMSNGRAALEYFVKHCRDDLDADPPDLIVLDINMPEMSGLEFLEASHGMRQDVPIPVIVLSVSENPRDRKECLRLGVQDYFTKPWNLDDYMTFLNGPLKSQLIKAYPEIFDKDDDRS